VKDGNLDLDPEMIVLPSAGGAFMPILITGHNLHTDEDKPIIPPYIHTGTWALSETIPMIAQIMSFPHPSQPVMAWLTATHILDQPGEFDTRADFVLDDYYHFTDMIELNLDTTKPGQWEVQLNVAFGDNRQASFSTFVDFPSHDMVMATDDQIAGMFSVAYSHYDRRWRLINDRIRDLWDELRRKRQELEDIYATWAFLEEQNRIIDRIPRIYRPRVTGIQDELDNLPAVPDVPTDQDITDLENAVADAGTAIDDCEKRVKDLEDRIAELEKEADDLKQEQLDDMEERHQIFLRYGWTGRYGFRDNDRHGGYGEGSGAHWGYVGSGGSGPQHGTADYNRHYELQRKILNARKEWRKKRETIDRLKEELEEAKKECEKLKEQKDELEQSLTDAQQAQAQQQAYDARQAKLESDLADICREIQALLKALADWCDANPAACPFKDEIKALMEDCPPENWETFWQNLNRLIAKKKTLEEQLEKDAENKVKEIDKVNEDIDAAGKAANDLLNEERRERERAEQARRDAAAAAKAEAERQAKALRDCLEEFAKWIADNEQYLKRGNTAVLEKILEGATAAGEVAAGAAGAAAGGKPMGPAIGSALAQSLFNLGASIFYAWVGDKAGAAVKKIADRHVLQIIAASLIGDQRKCGVIKTDGATSYFFFKDGDRTIVFRISATYGLECLGEA
jgi:predicted  nucleic acid-binding Zn-ribbon protein